MRVITKLILSACVSMMGMFQAAHTASAASATDTAAASGGAVQADPVGEFDRLLAQGTAPLQALTDLLGRYGDDPVAVRALVAAAVQALAGIDAGGVAPSQAAIDAAAESVMGLAFGLVPGTAKDAVTQGVLLAGADPTKVAGFAATAAGPGGGTPTLQGTGLPVAGGGGGNGGGVSPSS